MIRTEVRLGWKSIPGHRHQVEGRENEDALLAIQEHPYFDAVMLLADGMGGHPEPRRAAETAVAAARDFLLQTERLEELEGRRVPVPALLQRAVEHANRQVRRLGARVAASGAGEKPPGCTLTIAAVAEGRLSVALVGDGSAFLLRDGRLRPLAGGEERRFGSRPEEYLGRADQVEMEAVSESVRPGDRLLLCTDGLTRYFADRPPGMEETAPRRGPAPATGLERLQQVVARLSADPQALASQLTADGRGEQYEDDTTVILAEIGDSREEPAAVRQTPDPPASRVPGRQMPDARRQTPDAVPERAAGGRSSGAGSAGVWRLVSGVLLALIAVGLYWWRPWQQPHEAARLRPVTTPAVDVSGLPRGGALLVDPQSGRLYLLRTRPVGAPTGGEPLMLRELRSVPGRGVIDTGNPYRLDPARGRLIAPSGRVYPVTVDGGSGLIQVQQAGTLRVETEPPGLSVLVDGFAAGPTPLSVRLKAGRHQVQIVGRGAGGRRAVLVDTPWEVPARATTTLSLSVPGQTAGRGAR